LEGADGIRESENATVVTPLSNHAVFPIDESDTIRGRSLSHVLMLRPELNCLQQGEAELTKALLDHYLVPPPKTGLLSNSNSKSSVLLNELFLNEYKEHINGGSQSSVLEDQFLNEFIFKGEVQHGFFVEAGAEDFLLNTNTLLFELLHSWTGLLVEPVAMQFQHGLNAGRNVWGSPVCLALRPSPHFAFFANQALPGVSMSGLVLDNQEGDAVAHQCFPLYSLLLAIGNPKVNYFSLDIEGAELQVLQSVPWHLVDIEVISVEHHLLGKVFPGSRSELHKYLLDQNYTYIGTLGGKDDIFVATDMWNGPYYWNKEDLPEEWEHIFSFSQPESEFCFD